MSTAAERVADWLSGAAPKDEGPADLWACVEIFGHRKHYGRVSEVEKFGTRLLRVDVPRAAEAPLLGEGEQFETFCYGGGAIFSLTPMTEEAARAWAKRETRPESVMRRLPPPETIDRDDDFEGDEEDRF